MNKTRRISLSLFSLFLLLGAVPAWAVNPHSGWNASRSNTIGTSNINMSPSATTFCYLSRVSMTDIDTGSEVATCRVVRGAVVWSLQATLGASSDADVACSAYCYTR